MPGQQHIVAVRPCRTRMNSAELGPVFEGICEKAEKIKRNNLFILIYEQPYSIDRNSITRESRGCRLICWEMLFVHTELWKTHVRKICELSLSMT